MRLLLSAIVTAGSLILAIAAFAQSATTTPAATVPVNPASAAPVASGKRFACQTASQGMRGQVKWTPDLGPWIAEVKV